MGTVSESMTESKPPPKENINKAVKALFYFLDRNNNMKLDVSEIFCGLMLLLGGSGKINPDETEE